MKKFISSSNLPQLIFMMLFFLSACKEQMVDYQTNDCKRQPTFIKNVGFDPNRSAFSTSEKRQPGLLLMQINLPGDTSNGGRKIFQHPSWKSAGSLGPIQIDPSGNIFVAPVPTVNTLTNPAEKQNIVYKVDAATGEMKVFTSLPVPKNIPSTNPYGILGLAYICESNTLYVSTVLGSDRKNEIGIIYALDAGTGKVIDKITGIDAMGLGISYISGQRRLYYASARTSDIYSVKLKEDGNFTGKSTTEFSLDSIATVGDDKVRRIKFDNSGQMQLYTITFNFNLTAPTENKENLLRFNYDENEKRWKLNK
jgi:hypothetical protein